jgi:surfeit locus 1 family protein
MSGRQALWPLIAAAVLGFVFLSTLGVWQLQRLAWKQGLLDVIALRSTAAPVTVAELADRHRSGADTAFLRVQVTGTFLHDQEKLVIATFEGGPGFDVVTPVLTSGDTLVLVDRGTVPETMRSRPAESAAAGLVTVVRPHSPVPGLFDPNNDAVANRWYWWDVPAMLATTDMPPGVTALPLILQAEPSSPAQLPRAKPVAAAFRNNHLNYAVTWFSLALALAAVAGIYVRGQMKESSA